MGILNQAQFTFWIGFILTTVGFLFTIIGSWEKKTTITLADNKDVQAFRGETRPYFFFTAKHPSFLKGNISGTGAGPFEMCIFPYLFNENISQLSPSNVLDVYCRVKGPGQRAGDIKPFETKIPEGKYCVYFDSSRETKIETKFNLKLITKTKPHENSLGFGRTLFGVGIPVLITGIVGIFFL